MFFGHCGEVRFECLLRGIIVIADAVIRVDGYEQSVCRSVMRPNFRLARKERFEVAGVHI